MGIEQRSRHESWVTVRYSMHALYNTMHTTMHTTLSGSTARTLKPDYEFDPIRRTGC